MQLMTGGSSTGGWEWGGVGTGHAQEESECARKENACVWGPGGKQGSLDRTLGPDPIEPPGSCKETELDPKK